MIDKILKYDIVVNNELIDQSIIETDADLWIH